MSFFEEGCAINTSVMGAPGEIISSFDPEVRRADAFGPIRWADLYGNNHPVEVEIGFGKGRFLISAGERFPDVNYFGIERKARYFRIARPRIQKRRLLNVRILYGDALTLIHEAVPEDSVHAYHIYFPDPWWKKRHRKRRLFRAGFLEDLARTLIPGGCLYIATDVEEYFDEIAASISENPQFGRVDNPAERMEQAGYVPTNFEVKRAMAGSPIYRAVFERLWPSLVSYDEASSRTDDIL